MSETSITVSERAARRIGEILKAEPAGTMLRVSVEGGGCSGFQYKFDMERAKADDDLVIARDGATVLIDPVSVQYMAGSEIDFVEDLIGAVVQGEEPEGHRLLRLRHQLRAVEFPVIPAVMASERRKPRVSKSWAPASFETHRFAMLAQDERQRPTPPPPPAGLPALPRAAARCGA